MLLEILLKTDAARLPSSGIMVPSCRWNAILARSQSSCSSLPSLLARKAEPFLLLYTKSPGTSAGFFPYAAWCTGIVIAFLLTGLIVTSW